MDNLKMHTPDKAEENFRKLAELFPDAVTETVDENGEVVRAIDKDALMQEISAKVIDGAQERYQFTWPDKRKSVVLANAPIAKTLRLQPEKSVGRDGTAGSVDSDNIYIEGDNLDALKLLQETYLGKIKMIYIDPPYNTGNDFVYNDFFTQSEEEYSNNSGQTDEVGNQLVQNTEGNGRFHTDWLNMLYPRLRLAKDLLSEDGVIVISIDEHEVENLTKVCNEVFGEHNHVGSIIIKSNPRGSMSVGEIASLHEYLLIYSKTQNVRAIIGHELSEEMNSEYKYSDEKGKYRLLGLRMRGGFWRRSERPNLYFPIYVNPEDSAVSIDKSGKYTEVVFPIQPSTSEDGTWRWSKEKIMSQKDLLVAREVTRSGENVWDIYQKDYYARESGRRTKVKSIWDESEINYQNGSTEIKELLGSSGIFDYSKPVYLIMQAMRMIDFDDGDVVMDFFSGSATTAQAVLQLNAEDEIHRQFMMVQLQEQVNVKSETYSAGFKTICDIGEERIKRAGKKIREDSPLTTQDLDIGFRCFTIDSSNMKDVYYKPSEYGQMNLGSFMDNIKEDRTPEDLLIQVMLDLGVLLSSKIEQAEIAGKKVFSVADGYLIACFDKDVTDETVIEIAKRKPFYAVFRDSGMASDSVAANFEQIFETYSPNTVRKVL